MLLRRLRWQEYLIEPEIGSGIEVYVHRGMEIFNNEIRITAAPPTCEYGHEEYSTAAVRIADYNAKPGSPNLDKPEPNRKSRSLAHGLIINNTREEYLWRT